MRTKKLKWNEKPKRKKKFFLLRLNDEGHLILEVYRFNEYKNWENKILGKFYFPNNRKEKRQLMAEITLYVPEGETLYVEEGTFD